MSEYRSFGYVFRIPKEAAEHWRNEANRLAGIQPDNMYAGFAGLSAGESRELCEERAAIESREEHS